MWLLIVHLLNGVELLFVERVSRQVAWWSDVQFLELLLGLEGHLLSWCLTGLLIPE